MADTLMTICVIGAMISFAACIIIFLVWLLLFDVNGDEHGNSRHR